MTKNLSKFILSLLLIVWALSNIAYAGVEKPGSDFYFNLTGKIKFESKL